VAGSATEYAAHALESASPYPKESSRMYKHFAIEVVVWLIPVVVLLGMAIMITRTG
jgi:hypothetical protein